MRALRILAIAAEVLFFIGLCAFVVYVERSAPPEPVISPARLHAGECFVVNTTTTTWKVESAQEHGYIIRKVPESIYRDSIGYMLPVGVEPYLHRVSCKEVR